MLPNYKRDNVELWTHLKRRLLRALHELLSRGLQTAPRFTNTHTQAMASKPYSSFLNTSLQHYIKVCSDLSRSTSTCPSMRNGQQSVKLQSVKSSALPERILSTKPSRAEQLMFVWMDIVGIVAFFFVFFLNNVLRLIYWNEHSNCCTLTKLRRWSV